MARAAVELPAEDWHTIGTFLRKLRSQRGWSQDDAVARGKPGLSRAPLGQLENGRPTNNRPLRSTLEGIGRAYGLDDEWWLRVIHGDGTAPAPDPDVQARLTAVEESLRDLREAVEALLDREAP